MRGRISAKPGRSMPQKTISASPSLCQHPRRVRGRERCAPKRRKCSHPAGAYRRQRNIALAHRIPTAAAPSAPPGPTAPARHAPPKTDAAAQRIAEIIGAPHLQRIQHGHDIAGHPFMRVGRAVMRLVARPWPRASTRTSRCRGAQRGDITRLAPAPGCRSSHAATPAAEPEPSTCVVNANPVIFGIGQGGCSQSGKD